jgi:hypothetical protein
MTAEGSVYQRKSDGRWVAQYTDLKGKTRYLYRKTKTEARKALRQALKDRDDGYVPADKLTVGQYLDEWMDERKNTVSTRTWRVQESIVRCRVKPHVGSQRLCKLSGKEYTWTLPPIALRRTLSLYRGTHARNPQTGDEGRRTRQVHPRQPA